MYLIVWCTLMIVFEVLKVIIILNEAFIIWLRKFYYFIRFFVLKDSSMNPLECESHSTPSQTGKYSPDIHNITFKKDFLINAIRFDSLKNSLLEFVFFCY